MAVVIGLLSKVIFGHRHRIDVQLNILPLKVKVDNATRMLRTSRPDGSS